MSKGEHRAMGFEQESGTPKAVRSVYPPLVLGAVVAGIAVWSYTLNQTAREVPLLVGYGLLALLAIDLCSRVELPFSRLLRDFWGADFRNREMKHDPRWTAEASLFLWVAGCTAGMVLVGILPSVPVFVLAFMRLHGRRPWRESAVCAVATLGFVYAVFEVLLDYALYRGALFDAHGFANW